MQVAIGAALLSHHLHKGVETAMYSKVTVPLDGSELAERALDYARLIGDALSIPMEIIEAYDVLPPAIHNRGAMMATEQMLAEARRRSERYLAEVQARMQPAGLPVTTASLPGTAGQAVVDFVRSDPNALVVMSTHGRGGIARWALGSMADRLLHAVPNSLLVIRASAPRVEPAAIETILVPLDGSELAENSLDQALGLARALGCGVLLARITHTGQYYRSHLAAPRSSIGPSLATQVSDLTRADGEAVTEYLAAVKSRLTEERPDAPAIDTLHLRHDSPAEAIIDEAVRRQALVVMASHGRGGIGRMVLGSVADRVVRHSDSPVLVIRQQ